MQDIITMSQFGKWGRAGNQFFEYAFLTTYAKLYNLQLQIPPWVGNHIFDTEDPEVTVSLPAYKEAGGGITQPVAPAGDAVVGKDFQGYAQYHTSYFRSERERIHHLFQPAPPVFARLADAKKQLQADKVQTVGIHIRRGDYGQGIFPLVPLEWYRDWLRKRVLELGRFRLFISTEDVSVLPYFEEWYPQTVETLGIDLASEPMANSTNLTRDVATSDSRALDWYPDFYLLSQCNIILGGSSTFSFFAAMLGISLREYWRASLRSAGFEKTNPWNAYPILREHVKDFPQLEGITATANPYW